MIKQNEVEQADGLDERQPVESDGVTPAPEPNLGDFFVTPPSPTRGPDPDPPAEPPRQSVELPPLPFIGGAPSDFYAVLPPASSGAADVEPGPGAQPVDQLLVDQSLVDQLLVTPHQEDVPRAGATAQELALDAEVTQLREDLLLLASQRNTALEQVSLLRGQAAAQSSEAEAAGIRAEEAVDAMATGQRKLDEFVLGHASLVHDLQALVAREEEFTEAWEVAKAEAVASHAGARRAEATLTGCEEQMDKARERLIELAL